MPIRNNAFFSIGGTDVSSTIMSLDVSESINQNDAVAMSINARQFAAGLNDWSISGTFEGAANGKSTADQAFQDVYRTNAATTAIVYRNDTAAKSATNAEWTGTGVLSQLELAGSSPGERIQWNFTIVPGGALTRATA